MCSARTGANIPGRRRALLRYSRAKSLPNPLRVRVPASVCRYVRMERKYEALGTTDVGRMRKICVPGVQGIIIKILFLSDNLFFRLKMNFNSLEREKEGVSVHII